MNKKTINLLIIAYFFQPDKKVGALRASYWYRQLMKNPDYEVKVICGNPDAKDENVEYVPLTNRGFVSKVTGDVGFDWKKNILSHIEKNTFQKPDVTVVTGSPFGHFGLSKWIAKNWKTPVILDYRDPFANNPGFQSSAIKDALKTVLERRFNRYASGLVTVNRQCADIIQNFHQKPNAIVQNGYDETVSVQPSEPKLASPTFAYTGKFYFDPQPILEAIDSTHTQLEYAGQDLQGKTYNEDCIKDHGFVNYTKAVEIVAKNDVGLIQTYGEDFQSTTKIFDYIRCKRAILVVSDKHLHRGSIHEELSTYPNVFWTRNTKTDIIEAIEKIKSHNYVEPSKDVANKYSRATQLDKLLNLIQDLVN